MTEQPNNREKQPESKKAFDDLRFRIESGFGKDLPWELVDMMGDYALDALTNWLEKYKAPREASDIAWYAVHLKELAAKLESKTITDVEAWWLFTDLPEVIHTILDMGARFETPTGAMNPREKLIEWQPCPEPAAAE